MSHAIKIHTFLIRKVDRPFSIRDNYPREFLMPIGWNKDDNDMINSEKLNSQIIVNRLIVYQLEDACKQSPPQPYIILDSKAGTGLIYDHINVDVLEKTCRDFLKGIRNHFDVLSRDHDVFQTINGDSKHINVEFYAVVVSKGGIYVGHVYTWISPTDPAYCFMIGIRTAPHMSFLRMAGYGLQNASTILLQGVEDFAISKGATKIVIPHPIGAMIKIAEREGFRKVDFVTESIIGRGGDLTRAASNVKGICDKCYLREIKRTPTVQGLGAGPIIEPIALE